MRRRKKIAFTVACALGVACLGVAVAWCFSHRELLLWKAAASGNVSATRLLVWLGTDVNARDEHGNTAIFFSVRAHPQVVRVQLSAGADATVINDDGHTALRYALSSGAEGSIEADELLINAGALRKQRHPYMCIWNSRTAARHVKVLLRHGVNPDAPDGAPLRFFAENGHTSIVAMLLEHGARIDVPDAEGRTALVKAVIQSNPETVEYLVRHGANTAIKVGGRSLIDIARREREESATAPAAIPRCDRIVHFLEENESRKSSTSPAVGSAPF